MTVPNGFTGKFYQTLKEEAKLIVQNLFQKAEEEGMHPNSFCEGSITLIPKSKILQKNPTNQNPSWTQIPKILDKVLANPGIYKKDNTHQLNGVYLRDIRLAQYLNVDLPTFYVMTYQYFNVDQI